MRMFLGTEEEKEFIPKFLDFYNSHIYNKNLTEAEEKELVDKFIKDNVSEELWNARQEYLDEVNELRKEAEAKGQTVLVD